MLLIGLGGTGAIVAGRVKALQHDLDLQGSNLRILVLDQEDWLKRRNWPSSLERLTPEEFLLLPAEGARKIGAHASDWQEHLQWMPTANRLHTLNEITPVGAGNQRWLGRLAFFAADQEIWETIRKALQDVYSRRRPATRQSEMVVLVASAGGGTGSALLVDVSYVVMRLSESLPRTAYILLPGAGFASGNRSRANAYAFLRELYNLRYQNISFKASYPRLGKLEIEQRSLELWKRIYLFEPLESSPPPHEEEVDRIAYAIVAHLQPDLRREIVVNQQREISLSWPGRHNELCFCACGALSRPLVEAKSEPPTNEKPVSLGKAAASSERASITQDSDTLLDAYVGKAVREEAERVVQEISSRIADIDERIDEESRSEVRQSHRELRGLEFIVAKIVGENILEDNSQPTPKNWIDELKQIPIVRLFFKRTSASPNKTEERLESLSAWRTVRTNLWRAAHEYLKSAREGSRSISPREIRGRLKGGVISTQPSQSIEYHIHMRDWKKLILVSENTWLSSHRLQQSIEDRCSALLFIIGGNNFRNKLEEIVIDQLNFLDSESAESTDQSSNKEESVDTEVKPSNKMPGEKEQDDKFSLNDIAETLTQNVFSQNIPLTGQSSFGIALIPKSTIAQTDLDALRFRLVKVEGLHVWLYLEDALRPPRAILNLDRYQNDYRNEKYPELLHLDARFLEDPQFEDLLLDSEKLLCGNPDCNRDIAALPRTQLICPHCNQPICSRCGNPGCKVNNLHVMPGGRTAKSCPVCGGLNHAAWWICRRHGKVEQLISTEMEICPECIRLHQEDPGKYPDSSLSQRPDLEGAMPCPRCVIIANSSSSHKIFWIPTELQPFVRDGIKSPNGNNLQEVVKKYNLPEGFRCPNCRTILVPIHQPPGES